MPRPRVTIEPSKMCEMKELFLYKRKSLDFVAKKFRLAKKTLLRIFHEEGVNTARRPWEISLNDIKYGKDRIIPLIISDKAVLESYCSEMVKQCKKAGININALTRSKN